jgi:hypothetical protein
MGVGDGCKFLLHVVVNVRLLMRRDKTTGADL